jgi:hypothetical protein
VAAVERVPERVHVPRNRVRDHDELRGRHRRLHQHKARVQDQREWDVLEVVTVDVVEGGLEEVLLGGACGDRRAARVLVPNVLREGVVLAAHPDLAPHDGVRLDKEGDRREEEQPEHFIGGREHFVEAHLPRRRPVDVATGEQHYVAERQLDEEGGDVPGLEAVLPQWAEAPLWKEGGCGRCGRHGRAEAAFCVAIGGHHVLRAGAWLVPRSIVTNTITAAEGALREFGPLYG